MQGVKSLTFKSQISRKKKNQERGIPDNKRMRRQKKKIRREGERDSR